MTDIKQIASASEINWKVRYTPSIFEKLTASTKKGNMSFLYND